MFTGECGLDGPIGERKGGRVEEEGREERDEKMRGRVKEVSNGGRAMEGGKEKGRREEDERK